MKMKLHQTAVRLALGSLLILGVQAANATNFLIKGEEAKKLYNSLTGSSVQREGAAGHLYNRGQSILCRYTDVDITKNGKSVSTNDPSRYACSVKFNHNGLASPGPNP